jgi:hypothetical protein
MADIVEASDQAGRPRQCVIDMRTPMAGDRRRVTVTVTDTIWRPAPAGTPEQQPDNQPETAAAERN